jgi:hypothetical protein
MSDYFKAGSSRPDFLEDISEKLKDTDNRKNPEYLFGILYIIENTPESNRETLIYKLLEELIIQVVELHKK